MKVQILTVPYDSGHRSARMGNGPAHLIQHGLENALRELGHEVLIKTIEISNSFPTEAGTSFRLYRLLAEHIRRAIGTGWWPLVLAGNCGSTLGALAGIGHTGTGLVWFDSHGDFNTPETTSSGFLDGMALAVATGRCWRTLAATIPGFQALPENVVVHVGGRDFDTAELAMMEQSQMHLVRADSMRQQGIEAALSPALAELEQQMIRKIYIQLDLDVLDPVLTPANSYAAPGGLSADQVMEAIQLIGKHFEIVGASITAFDPSCDRDGLTTQAGLRLITNIIRFSAMHRD